MSWGSIAILILVIVLAGIILTSPPEEIPGAGRFAIVGERAPEFTLAGTEGTWSLRDHLGKPLIIAFWTTWCDACRGDLDILEEFHVHYGDRFEVVSVCPEYWSRVPDVLREHPVDFPVLYDPGERVTREYERLDHMRYPFTVFVDGEGRVSCVWAYALRDLGQLLKLVSRCGLM
jgi:peroxiredoxin